VPPPENPETAAAAFARTGQDAVTYARRVVGNALARNERHRAANRELTKQAGRGKQADPTPGALRNAARRFREARGLPVPEFPAVANSVPTRPASPARPTRSSEDEDDFSQTRIMKRDL